MVSVVPWQSFDVLNVSCPAVAETHSVNISLCMTCTGRGICVCAFLKKCNLKNGPVHLLCICCVFVLHTFH